MKYKFTGKTKVIGTITLNQIVCVTAFGIVSAGDLGGWIESEKNLSQKNNAWVSGNARVSGDAQVSGNAWVYSNARVSGNARVYGNARVSGDAQVSGNAKCTQKAFAISTHYHHITITDTHIKIGCQNQTIEFWKSAGFNEVKEMDGKDSAKAWVKYKDFILSLESDRNS